MHITLIACCGAKLDLDEAPAEEMYISQLFKKSLAEAKRNHSQGIFILSAKLGLVELDQVIEPYDLTLNRQSKNFRKTWAAGVAAQLHSKLIEGDTLTILAGRSYRDELIPLISESWEIEVPMAGLGIGEQLAWLTKREREY
jgi:hypothetical protein